MGIFKALTSPVAFVVDRVQDVTQATVSAVADVATTAVTATVQAGQQELNEAVASVKSSVETVQNTVAGVIDYAVNTTESLVGGAVSTVTSAVGTATTVASDVQEIASDLANGRIELTDFQKLVVDAWQGAGATFDNAQQLSTDTLGLLQTLYKVANEGTTLSLGNSDGLLGVNLLGSLLGGNTSQGEIPDTRGSIGQLPINITYTDQGITFGGETPITPLVTAALALFPATTALVPTLAPLNLGGLGVVGTIDKEGFTAKFYGIAGPSYNVGVASVGSTLEAGTYSTVNLLTWNDKPIADLPVLGDILGKLPVIGDLNVSLPQLDLHFDNKLYTQATASVDVLGVGPQGQVEVVTDLDHDIGILLGIAGKTAESALDGAAKVVSVALFGPEDSAAPADAADVQLIGAAAPAQDHALAA
ncbi:hypothetical protein WG219_04910 [Ectopseudomonas mendocina]|uniref:PE-PGRS family protein n=1 Tax=Ectopseudomonas mendocina TaxID=300 RepID=A0ABZ2RL53_ECTME